LLHHRLYDIAKTDLEAANILAKNNLYPQAIYFYAQSCEKASKSVVAFFYIHYEKKSEEKVLVILKNLSHNLMELALTTAKIFVDYERRLHVKRGGKESDGLIRAVSDSLKNIQRRKPPMIDLMALYAGTVKVLYQRFYTRLGENSLALGAQDPRWGVLRELYKHPKTRYLKFNTLSQFLFILLDKMDIYARYPMNGIGYTNIGFLKGPEIREACLLLGEMVEDLVSLVPFVWNKIESLKPNLT
jgi:hypothetical protein